MVNNIIKINKIDPIYLVEYIKKLFQINQKHKKPTPKIPKI